MFLGIWILNCIRDLLWRGVAWVATRPRVTNRLIARAKRTPYVHIRARDGSGDIYMERYWLFNPYPSESDMVAWEQWKSNWRRHLPSMRIHHICRPDNDRDLHDHPWNARTIVLRGWYHEELLDGRQRTRNVGDTGRLLFGQYHRIDKISAGGPWTLFTTWQYQGTWGFLVDGQKVPWRKYLGLEQKS